ncbi:S-layer homology domain-containing protein [Bacillus sp. FJAT-28004]|uniref:S-layer homology domain-containing protein n=1 Tax=Bacillus sp. FJAT-28004 TaxID=1679165 RepID=UPI0006B5BE0D|nr:S-layer homology domain-containing protein [Bacillus sp. FJAT-28004]
MKINNRKRLAVMLSTAMLMSIMPASVFAESLNKPAGTNAAAQAVTSSEGDIMKEGLAAPVDVAITKEKAEALARQYVSIPKEYVLQGASLNMEMMAGGKRNAWGLDFVKKVNGKHLGSIYVRIHADKGQLLEFNSYTDNPSAKPTYPLKVERDAAQQIALQFIDKIAADYKGKIQYNPDYGVKLRPPLTGEVVHSIRYDRLVYDIPYVDNYIELEVDSEGHIRRYSLQWDDTINFPKVDAKLTMEEANNKLRAAAAPQLAYIVPYNMQGKRKPLLSYELQPISIDAVTGQLKDQSRDSYFRAGTISETPVSEKPLGDEPKAGTVTEKQAIDAVKAAFALPAGAELNGSNYSENNNESTGETEAYWQLNWTVKKDGKEIGSASASVNGRTGDVRHFNAYMYNEQSQSGSPKVTLEQASALAVDAIKKRLPWLTDELYFVKPDPKQYEGLDAGEPRQYYFNFVHKIYGAAVEYDNVNLAIHSSTGEVVNYDANLSNFDYPAQAPVLIKKEQAVDSWLDYYRTQLTYRLVQNFSWNGQPIPIEKYKLMIASGEIRGDEVEKSTNAELVYQLVPRLMDESVFLDAETGGWRNRETGEVTQLEKPKAKDIEGHFAQRQLELMVAYKALDVKDGLVRPNEAVTRGELIKMLVLARSSGVSPLSMSFSNQLMGKASFNDVAADSSYFVYVESALEQNLIDVGDGSFNPSGKVSRDEMAELIVRALGYNALANYDHIFKASFKDSAEIENKGQAAIVVGLKIMSLSDGKFLPKKQVTRGEASVAFFRYLQSRAELQEAPLRM